MVVVLVVAVEPVEAVIVAEVIVLVLWQQLDTRHHSNKLNGHVAKLIFKALNS